jgi:hypothetical protein
MDLCVVFSIDKIKDCEVILMVERLVTLPCPRVLSSMERIGDELKGMKHLLFVNHKWRY